MGFHDYSSHRVLYLDEDTSLHTQRENPLCSLLWRPGVFRTGIGSDWALVSIPAFNISEVNRLKTSFFFFLNFWRTHVLFWGHWYPCFGFLVTSPLGFKARVGSALFAIFAEANVMYIP